MVAKAKTLHIHLSFGRNNLSYQGLCVGSFLRGMLDRQSTSVTIKIFRCSFIWKYEFQGRRETFSRRWSMSTPVSIEEKRRAG